MNFKNARYFVCDFETTVYKGQKDTQVWASAFVELFTENVWIVGSIEETFNYFKKLNSNVVLYYHNLKFDGSFWLDYLLRTLKFKQAYYQYGENANEIKWMKNSDMPSNSFKYVISDLGQWYTLTIKVKDKIIEIRDSLKLIPFSVEEIGKSFGTKHKKLKMKYEGVRYPGCNITTEERSYIKNDVLVVKEAVEIMFKDGHNLLTIGSCCLAEYKKICRESLKLEQDYSELFPNLYERELDSKIYGSENEGEYIRRSYKGGWTYVVKGKENKVFHNGLTADVNSLYPSQMHSDSGNRYPVGIPKFWQGDYIPDKAIAPNKYYFVRIKTRFYLKEGYLPFIQLKNTLLYNGTECLESSDMYDSDTDSYISEWTDSKGITHDTRVTLTLTMIDYELIKEHYHLVDFEILDGCYFYSQEGIFDEYIDKYKEIKMNSKGAKRSEAKLFLNNLYGKMATSTDSSFKFAYMDEDKIKFKLVRANDKKPGYIPCGSAITSYARNFTIRHAQLNYHGLDKPGFIYADTDSIHCDLKPDELIGIKTHKTEFNHWALESYWDEAFFIRQKTYVEHITHKDGEPIESPYYDIKCAGLPDRCKKLFLMSIRYMTEEEKKDDYSEEELRFLFKNDKQIIRSIYDFKRGIEIPGKLLPKRIHGGILLKETSFKMR